jgi:hypothetical protein
MKNANRPPAAGINTKPLHAGRGVAERVLQRCCATTLSAIGISSANACLPILPAAIDAAQFGLVLVWGARS